MTTTSGHAPSPPSSARVANAHAKPSVSSADTARCHPGALPTTPIGSPPFQLTLIAAPGFDQSQRRDAFRSGDRGLHARPRTLRGADGLGGVLPVAAAAAVEAGLLDQRRQLLGQEVDEHA